MKDGFKSIEDILDEVGEEEGLSYREIRDLWTHQKLYINKQMETDYVYAIFIPSIGTLSLNVKQAEKELRGKPRKRFLNFTNKVNLLKKHPNYKESANSHKRVTGVNRLARYIINHYETGIQKIKRLIPHRDCWGVIEKYSNNKFTKK